jgi:dTDP-glucose pyrophosphorylase
MNNNIKELIQRNEEIEISSDKNLEYVIDKLNKNQIKTCFVIKNKKLVGSVTDGDIRRSILKNISKTTQINHIMNNNPIKFYNSEKNIIKKISRIENKNKIFIFPVVNVKNIYLGYIKYDRKFINAVSKSENYDVVIMAGGFGKRLRPLTNNKPKPLIEINGIPIIYRIISKIDNINVNKIYVTLHYKSEIIIKSLKKLKSNKIVPIIEKKPQDTFGSLIKMKKKLSKNIMVINSDIVTNLNTNDLFEFHLKNKADFTMCAKKHETRVDFGVIKRKGKKINKIDEKPTLNHWINTGIYFLKKKCIFNSKKPKMNAVEFINSLILKNYKILFYPMYETWFDIGTHEQLKLANNYMKDR